MIFRNHELGFAQAFAHGDLGGAVHAIKDLATARPDGGFGNFSFPAPAITPERLARRCHRQARQH